MVALALSLAGGVASQIGSANANKKRQDALDTQRNSDNAWYNKEYYTDEIDRTENKSMLRTLAEKLKEQNKQAQATAAITGATPEMALAQQNNSNKTYADVVNKIAGRASQRKDMITQQHRADVRSEFGMQDALDAARGETWKNLGTNAAGLGANAIGSMGGTKPTGLASTTGEIAPAVGDGVFDPFDQSTRPLFV
jgi:hypothetical protein